MFDSATPLTASCQAPLSSTISEFAQTHIHWTDGAIQPSHSLLSPYPFAFNLCQHRGKYWSFSFSISPSNEYSGLILFRNDWFDLAVQGTLKSLLQHHSSKASVLQCSTFFMVQLLHLYLTTGKTIALSNGPLLAKWCLCFLIHCLGLSQLSFQGASIFWFHDCSHCQQWFWSPGR